MSDNARRVGALIRDLRTAQGLSQGALAERVNNVAPPEAGAMLQPRVSAYEKGVWMPSPDTLRLFASALNVPYAQLAAAAGYADAARQRRAGAPLVLVRDDLTDPEEEHEIAGCLFRLLLERCERRRLVRFVREALRALPHAPAWAILALPAVLHRIAWALEQGRIVIDNLN